MNSKQSIISRFVLPWVIYLLLTLGLAGYWLKTGDLNLKYDWGFSLYDWQNTWRGAVSSWSDQFMGDAHVINSGWLLAFLISSFGTLFHLVPTILLPTLVIALHVLSGMGMYQLLSSRGVSYWAAILGGVIYSFSPLVFIRSIIGFVFYLIAFAFSPWFIRYWWEYTAGNSRRKLFLAAVLLSLISAQLQFVFMLLLFVIVDFIITKDKLYRVRSVKGTALLLLTLFIVHLPWLQLLLWGGASVTDRNALGSSLSVIDSLPHSTLRTLFGADHHILFATFDNLLAYRPYVVSSLLLLLLALIAVLIKSTKETKLFFILLAIAWPLALGTQVPTQAYYQFIYNYLPFSNVFREVYHWAFLITISLSVLIAFTLSFVGERIKQTPYIMFGWMTFSLLLITYWTMPYWSGQADNYVATHNTPEGYSQIAFTGDNQPDRLQRSLFLPPLGFIKYKDDNNPGATNTDTIATSTNLAQMPYQSSLLDFPTDAQALRNNVVMSILGATDQDIAALLRAAAVNQIITRPDLESEFKELFEIPYNEDPYTAWKDPNYDDLLSQKSGISLHTKYEGVNVYQVDEPAQIISLGENPVLAGNDWSYLATNNGDAVFFINDITLDGDITSLPKIGAIEDYIAAKIQPWELLGTAAIDFKTKASDGWIRSNAAWWMAGELVKTKENYIYTTSNNSLKIHNSFSSVEYVPLIKYLVSEGGESIAISVNDYQQSISTKGQMGWRWEELEPVTLSGENIIKIDNEGEAGLAQLIFVPKEELISSQKYWQVQTEKTELIANEVQDSIEVTKVATEKYNFIAHTDQKRVLIFRMGYDTGWKMIFEDGKELLPQKVNGYAMTWILPAGDTVGSIVYTPQKKYSYLLIMAGIWLSLLWFAGNRPD